MNLSIENLDHLLARLKAFPAEIEAQEMEAWTVKNRSTT